MVHVSNPKLSGAIPGRVAVTAPYRALTQSGTKQEVTLGSSRGTALAPPLRSSLAGRAVDDSAASNVAPVVSRSRIHTDDGTDARRRNRRDDRDLQRRQ